MLSTMRREHLLLIVAIEVDGCHVRLNWMVVAIELDGCHVDGCEQCARILISEVKKLLLLLLLLLSR